MLQEFQEQAAQSLVTVLLFLAMFHSMTANIWWPERWASDA